MSDFDIFDSLTMKSAAGMLERLASDEELNESLRAQGYGEHLPDPISPELIRRVIVRLESIRYRLETSSAGASNELRR